MSTDHVANMLISSSKKTTGLIISPAENDLFLSRSAQDSLYYDLISLLRDVARDSAATVSEQIVLMPGVTPIEKRICQLIDLSIKELSFNHFRSESWIILHSKLVEWINILCDEIADKCLPDLLPSFVHLDFFSPFSSLESILDGSQLNGLDAGLSAKSLLRFKLSYFYSKSEGDVEIVRIAERAWVRQDQENFVAEFFTLISFKNILVRSSHRLLELFLHPSVAKLVPAGDFMLAYISQGLLTLNLSYQFRGGSKEKREFLIKTLYYFNQGLFLY